MCNWKATVNYSNSVILAASIFCVTLQLANANSAEPNLEERKESLCQTLKHQEDLVRSIECTCQVFGHPTSEDMIPLIKEYLRAHNKLTDLPKYMAKGDTEADVIKCWVKALPGLYKFRVEQGRPKPDIWTFDGQIERQLNENTRKGSIERGATHGLHEGWNAPANPFLAIYHYAGAPYSEIVRNGDNYKIAVMPNEAGKMFTHVWVRHPKFKSRSFHLLFDEHSRLVEREIIDDRYHEKSESVHEKHLIANYKSFQDSSGEMIWFPHNVVFSYIVGTLPDGRMAEWSRTSVEIKDIIFNPEIPEEQFSIDFPPDTEIYDGLNHRGRIAAKEVNQPPAAPVVRKVTRWNLIIAGGLVLVIVSIIITRFLYKKRRRSLT